MSDALPHLVAALAAWLRQRGWSYRLVWHYRREANGTRRLWVQLHPRAPESALELAREEMQEALESARELDAGAAPAPLATVDPPVEIVSWPTASDRSMRARAPGPPGPRAATPRTREAPFGGPVAAGDERGDARARASVSVERSPGHAAIERVPHPAAKRWEIDRTARPIDGDVRSYAVDALGVTCPKCSAAPGERCTEPNPWSDAGEALGARTHAERNAEAVRQSGGLP